MNNNREIVTVIGSAVIVAAVCGGFFVANYEEAVLALLTCSVVSLISLFLVNRLKEDRGFVIRIWLLALGLRILMALAIYFLGLRDRLAPDWATYDFFGWELTRYWQEGGITGAEWITSETARYRSGWGMYYFVAAVYYVTGRNALALQLLSGVAGANACVLVYRITALVYPVKRVARVAATLAAISPSLVLWSSQGLKEPLIVFLLTTTLFLTLRSAQRITIFDSFLLLLAIGGLYALRHYVAYVVFLAVAGSLVFSSKKFSPKRIMQGAIAVFLLGLVFAYYGAGDVATKNLDLQRIQAGREWSAKASESGYGGSVDITDTRQALIYLPLGTVFFLFAPFPWMIKNLNHLIALPEMIVWWAASPLLFAGFWYAFRHRLLSTLGICLFTAGLTMAYALYLTNFGTAHRMRVQILSFFIIFVCIGWHRLLVARGRKRASRTAGHLPVGLTPAIAAGRQIHHVRDRWNH